MTTRNTLNYLLAIGRTFVVAPVLLAVAALAITAGSASAEIVVDGSANWISGSSPVSGTFDASVSDKLVVIVTGEHGFNQTANGYISGVTYDGVAMTELINRTTIKASTDPLVLVDDTWNAIYYMDNPGSVYTAGLIEATVSARGSMTVLGLSGTAPGAGNTVIGERETSSAELTTSAGSIVVASYGMGGSGNTAFVNNVTVDDPLTFLSRQNNGGGRWWDGHVTAYANGVDAGTEIYSVTDTTAPGADGRTGAHLIAAEFLAGAPPRNLTLQVDTATGATTLLGDPTRDITINYYEITSEGDSLDSVNWSSLADQDFEESGPVNGTGNGWEEAGGAGSGALAEAFLLGDSTIGAAQSISLGRGFNTLVGSEDLVFTYLTDSGAVIEGLVEYVFSRIPGDTDNNGVVDAADYIALKTHMGMDSQATPAEGDCDGDGDVDWDDLQLLTTYYGQASTNAATIPEPATLFIALAAGLPALLKRRRSRS